MIWRSSSFYPRKVLFVYLSHPYNSEILDSEVAYKTYATVPQRVTTCFMFYNLFLC